MPLYQRPTNPEDDIEENTNEPAITQIVDEEATWKKRYSDLRSHSQKQLNEATKRIAALEAQTKAPQQQALPKTKEEVEEWAKKYPDVYGLVKSIVGLDLTEATESVNARLKVIDEKEAIQKKERAELELSKLHPDFFDTIAPSDEFRDWLDSKSATVQDAMYGDELDVNAASEVITLYKFETGLYTPAKQPEVKKLDPRDAARDVRVPANRPTPSASTGDYDFSESQIEKMSMREYEALEDKIDAARHAGRILMDVTRE